MERGLGTVLIVIGVLTVAAGVLVMTGALSWFGQLPGDVRIDRGSTRVFIPTTSMLLVSVVLTVAINVVLRFFR